KQMVMAHHGVFIVSPEYNVSIPPLLQNALNWIARVRVRNESPLAAYRDRVFALGVVSADASGGAHALIALRRTLEIGCGAQVLPDQIAVAHADQAFNHMDDLVDGRLAGQLELVAARLVDATQELARVPA